MSNERRRQQPQQQQAYHPQQQQFYTNYPQQYAQEAHNTQYGGPSWQAAHVQQPHQFYQPSQQYSSANPYGYADSTQFPATSSPYAHHNQYQSAVNDNYQQSAQSYASPNAAAYSQAGYLASDYAASSSHLSSGHSPNPSTGRSRLNNFVFPSSPSLESNVAHLSLGASLPTKPTSATSSASASRPNPGMAYGSQLRPLSTNAYAGQSHAGAGQGRSDISLRYPPLPTVPERPVTPPGLRFTDKARASESHTEGSQTKQNAAALDKSIQDYVSSLCTIIDTYQQRDDLLRLRTEAVGFEPKRAYLAWQTPPFTNPDSNNTESEEAAASNPILGVRLLQRLDKIQRENQELGRLLSSGANLSTASSVSESEVQELRREVQESHLLIDAMDKALNSAEARAVVAERALEVACRDNSTSIVPTTAMVEGEGDGRKSLNISKGATGQRRGSKAGGIANHAAGGTSGGAGQQRNKAKESTRDAPAATDSAGGGTTKNKQRQKEGGGGKTIRSDTTKSAPVADGKIAKGK